MSSRSIITQAIVIAEAHLTPDSYIMTLVANKNDWKYPPMKFGKELVDLLCSPPTVVPRIFMYKPMWRFSKALGYSNGKDIYINSYRINSLKQEDLVGLLLHELFHLPPYNCSHGSNWKTSDKCVTSVNYFVSENV